MIRRIAAGALVSLSLLSCAPDVERPKAALDQAKGLELELAYQGLCDARALAQAGDIWGASDIFNTRAHAYLHEVAADVQAVDREVAARLLQAKQTLEAGIATPDTANPQLVVGAFSSLETALGNTAVALGLNRPACGGAAP